MTDSNDELLMCMIYIFPGYDLVRRLVRNVLFSTLGGSGVFSRVLSVR